MVFSPRTSSSVVISAVCVGHYPGVGCNVLWEDRVASF